MIKFSIRLIAIVLLLSFYGCEQGFEPKSPVKGIYAIYCAVNFSRTESLLNGESYSCDIKAYLTKVYDTIGTKTFVIENITSISGANIEISIPGASMLPYKLNEVLDNGRCKYYYRHLILSNVKGGESIKLNAKLPDGQNLSSSTVAPIKISQNSYSQSYDYDEGFRVSDIIPKYWTFDFTKSGEDRDGHLMSASWFLDYKYKDQNKKVEIPVDIDNNAVSFAKLSYSQIFKLNCEAAKYKFNNIAIEDTLRKNYALNLIELNVIEYDENLSKYYLSTSGNSGTFSIRTDFNAYSNIKGGCGIFGSSFKLSKEVKFYIPYVRSLGYQFSYFK